MNNSRKYFLLSVGSMSLAACSSGAGVVLPPRLKANNGSSVALPTLSINRSGARSVTVAANQQPFLTYTYDAQGITATTGSQTIVTPFRTAPASGGRAITDDRGRTLSRTGNTWSAKSAEGKALTVKQIDSGHSLWSFTAPKPVNIMIANGLVAADSRLTKYKDYVMRPASTRQSSSARAVKDIVCYQNATYVMGMCGSFACGTWFVSNYCTGSMGSSYGGANSGGSAGGGTASANWDCLWAALIAAGVLTTTTITETSFVLSMIAVTGGLVLVGPEGAVAAVVAALMGLLLTLGIFYLDDAVMENMLHQCGIA